MNPVGWLWLMFLFGLGIICGVAFLILIVIGVKNESKKTIHSAFKCVGGYILFVLAVDGIWTLCIKHLENKPQVSVKADTITILNEGTLPMGSDCEYVLSNEAVIKEVDQPFYQVGLYERFGYTFQAKKEGQVCIGVFEHDCGHLAYADFYMVTVDGDLNVSVDKVEHIDENMREVVTEKYPFAIGALR